MDTFWNYFSQLDAQANLAELIGFVILVITLFNTYVLRSEQRKGNQVVRIRLEVKENPASVYQLPGTIRLKDFSRAEVMGRLGMIRIKDAEQKFFKLGYVQKDPNFLTEIERIQSGKQSNQEKIAGEFQLVIPCNQEEYDQFEF